MIAGTRTNVLATTAILFFVAACSTNTTTTAPGGSTPAETPSETASETPSDTTPDTETPAPKPIRIVASGKGYTPSTVTIKRGTPTVVEFVLTTEETCARDLVIPDLDIEKRLVVNVPLRVEVPADEARTYDFECSMQMYKGTIVVE
jgi:hypothetical protein